VYTRRMNFQAILSGAGSNPRPATPGRCDLKIGPFDYAQDIL